MIFMNWRHIANTLNHIFDVECTRDELTLKKHNKMKNVWEALHKLQPREERCNLGDYTLISLNVEVITTLQEGLKVAHRLF